jgi:hypothetical protein
MIEAAREPVALADREIKLTTGPSSPKSLLSQVARIRATRSSRVASSAVVTG